MNSSSPLPSLLLIPSGIGCEVGGYAGDAIPFARLLARASGCLITHPNVMNGASLYWNDERIQYVEGYSLDQFVCGNLFLNPIRHQKVGVLLDAGLEPELRVRHLQVVDGCRATLGLNIGPVVYTDTPLGISVKASSSGASWGNLTALDSLLRAGDRLKQEGATAIAVVTRFPDNLDSKELDAYRQGRGVDLVAGGVPTGTTRPVLDVVISPPGGHGKNIYRELGAYNVLLYSRIENDNENPDFITGNQIARVGLVCNPQAFDSTS